MQNLIKFKYHLQLAHEIFNAILLHYRNQYDVNCIHVNSDLVHIVGFGYALVFTDDDEQFTLVGIYLGFQNRIYAIPFEFPIKKLLIEDDLCPPPAEDSPSNILNVLNDDCLIEIFERISLMDLDSMADACKKFRDLGKRIITVRLSKGETFICDFESENPENWSNILMRSHKFFLHYGPIIQSIDFRFQLSKIENYDKHSLLFYKSATLVNLITYFHNSSCMLKKLNLQGFDIPLNWFQCLNEIFFRLDYLSVSYCDIDCNIELCENLTELYCNSVEEPTLRALFHLDLKKVHTFHWTITKDIFPDEDNPPPPQPQPQQQQNGEEQDHVLLEERSSFFYPLRNLKYLLLKDNCSLTKLIKVFNALNLSNSSIESLKIIFFKIEENEVERILQFKQLTKLEIVGFMLKKEHVKELTAKLPNLKEFIICTDNLCLKDAREMIENKKIRDILKFECNRFSIIEEYDYKEFLHLLHVLKKYDPKTTIIISNGIEFKIYSKLFVGQIVVCTDKNIIETYKRNLEKKYFNFYPN